MKAITDYPAFLTVAQFAELAQVSMWKAYEMVRARKVPAIHVGSLVRIPRDVALEHLTQPTAEPDPEVDALRRDLARGKRKKSGAEAGQREGVRKAGCQRKKL